MKRKFIVMQNASHKEEIGNGFMWSPQKIKLVGRTILTKE